MKKLSLMIAAIVAAGSVSSWAQGPLLKPVINNTANEVDQILFGPAPITFTGKTTIKTQGSITASKLAGLTPDGGTLEFAEILVGLPGPDKTNYPSLVIGTGFSLVTTNQSGATNTYLVGDIVLQSTDPADVDLSAGTSSKSVKFVSGWYWTGYGYSSSLAYTDFLSTVETVISNSQFHVTGTLTDPSHDGHSTTNVSAKVVGYGFFDGSSVPSAFSASIGKGK
jgi:hypothetical protein